MKEVITNIWKDEDVYILGGGASVLNQFNIPFDLIDSVRRNKLCASVFASFMSQLFDKNVIGLNHSYLLGNWIDITYFIDPHMELMLLPDLGWYKGRVITSCEKFINHPRYEYIPRVKGNTGIHPDKDKLYWNYNSGGMAVEIAAKMQAKRIILIGFDMKTNADGYRHWHVENQKANVPNHGNTKLIENAYRLHKLAFENIIKDLKELNIPIYNTSPDTALEGIPKADINEFL